MELSKLYAALLASMNVVADKDGLLSLEYGDQSFPAAVEGKRLVLPTPELLRQGLGDNLIAFHPLSENILRGESPVLKKLKTMSIRKLEQVFSMLIEEFVSLTVDHKRHSKMSPDQKELLQTMPDADEKTYATLEKIFEACASNSRRKLLTIYLNRGGKLKLEKFARAAIVSFPIMQEFDNDDTTIYGVKCRKKDFVGLRQLFDYVVPGAQDSNYSYGSNDSDVPFFDALVHAYINVATQLNSRISLFKKHLSNADDLMIDLNWATPDNLKWSKYRGAIPALEGNEGIATAESNETPEPVSGTRVSRAIDLNRAAEAAASIEHGRPAQASPQQRTSAQTETESNIRKSSHGLNWQDVVQAQNRRLLPGSYSQPQPAAVPYSQGAPWNAGPAPSMNAGWGPPVSPPGFADAPGPGYGPNAGGSPPGYDAYGRPMVNFSPPPMQGNIDPRVAGFMGQPGYYNPGRMPSFGYPEYGYGYNNPPPPGWGNPNPPPPGFGSGYGYGPNAGNVPVYGYRR